jgi:S-adenosylmethionine synthetase
MTVVRAHQWVVDDCLRSAVLLSTQDVVVNPQTKFVVIAGINDAALGMRPELLDIFRIQIS